jgi:hypothetical protein
MTRPPGALLRTLAMHRLHIHERRLVGQDDVTRRVARCGLDAPSGEETCSDDGSYGPVRARPGRNGERPSLHHAKAGRNDW